MSIFGTEESRSEDVHNIALSISRIEIFMQYNPIEGKKASEGFNVIAEQIRLLSECLFYLNGPKLSVNTNQANIL